MNSFVQLPVLFQLPVMKSSLYQSLRADVAFYDDVSTKSKSQAKMLLSPVESKDLTSNEDVVSGSDLVPSFVDEDSDSNGESDEFYEAVKLATLPALELHPALCKAESTDLSSLLTIASQLKADLSGQVTKGVSSLDNLTQFIRLSRISESNKLRLNQHFQELARIAVHTTITAIINSMHEE